MAARSSHSRSSLPILENRDWSKLTVSKSPTRASRTRRPASLAGKASLLSLDNFATDLSLTDSRASSKMYAETPRSPGVEERVSRRRDRVSLSPRLTLDKPRKSKSSDQSWAPTFEELDFPASPVKAKPGVSSVSGSSIDTHKQSVTSTEYPKRQAKTPMRHCSVLEPTMDIRSPNKSSHQREPTSSPRRRQPRSVTKETQNHRSQRSTRTNQSDNDWVQLLELDTFFENRGAVPSKPEWEDFSNFMTSPGQRRQETNWKVPPQQHQNVSLAMIGRPSNDSEMKPKLNHVSHHSDTPRTKIKRRLTRKTVGDRDVDSPTKQSSPSKSGRLGVANQAMRRRNQTPVRTRPGQPSQ